MPQIEVFGVPGSEPSNSFPAPPEVYFELSNFSIADGHLMLTPDMLSEREVDTYADQLVKQIEKARGKAKRYLKTNRPELIG